MIHSMHMSPSPYPEWYFAARHALVCMFAFFLALLLLLAQPHIVAKPRLPGVPILLTGTYLGVQSLRARLVAVQGAKSPTAPRRRLVTWLNDQGAKHHGLVVVLKAASADPSRTPASDIRWCWAGTRLPRHPRHDLARRRVRHRARRARPLPLPSRAGFRDAFTS